MTSRDLKNLEAFANRSRSRSKEQPHLDEEMAGIALETVGQLESAVGLAEEALVSLGLLFEKALVGAVGISLTEIRSQLPALREAAKEAGG